MSESRSLIKNTLVYAIGNIGSKVLSFILVPIFSFYLTKSELGNYDLLITTVSLFIPIVTIQISDATYRWILQASGERNDIKKAITNGMIIMLFSTTIFYALIFLASFIFKIEYEAFFLVILLFSSYLPFFQQVLRALGMNKWYSISGIVSTILMAFASVFFLVFLKMGVIGLFWSSITSLGVSCIFVILIGRFWSYFNVNSIDIKLIKQMIVYSWPLMPNAISWWLITAVDRYIILYFLHNDSNGIYAISSKFPSIILVLNSVFLLAWQDHAIQKKNDDTDFTSRLFNNYVKFEFGLAIILIALSKPLVYFFVDHTFIDAWKYMPFLYLSVVFSSFSSYVGVGYQKSKNTKGILTTTIWGALVNIVVSLLLIKFIGMYATGIASFISFLIVYYLRIRETGSYFKLDVKKVEFNKLLLCSLVMIALVLIFDTIIASMALFIIAMIFFIISNKELIAKLRGEVIKVYNKKIYK